MEELDASESKNVDFIFDVMRMKFDHLLDAVNTLDQKISVAVAFLITLVAGTSLLFRDEFSVRIRPYEINFFTLGILLLFFAILLCIFALATKNYSYPPHEDALYSNDALQADPQDFKLTIIADMKAGFQHNRSIQEPKAHLLNISLWLSAAGLFLLISNFL